MSTAERMYDDRDHHWRGPSMRIHPAWIVLLILGNVVPLFLWRYVETLTRASLSLYAGR